MLCSTHAGFELNRPVSRQIRQTSTSFIDTTVSPSAAILTHVSGAPDNRAEDRMPTAPP